MAVDFCDAMLNERLVAMRVGIEVLRKLETEGSASWEVPSGDGLWLGRGSFGGDALGKKLMDACVLGRLLW